MTIFSSDQNAPSHLHLENGDAKWDRGRAQNQADCDGYDGCAGDARDLDCDDARDVSGRVLCRCGGRNHRVHGRGRAPSCCVRAVGAGTPQD